ncbi:MAG: hypothetical protein Kow0081_5000 [Candidatus Dojkabacteria bacterium]
MKFNKTILNFAMAVAVLAAPVAMVAFTTFSTAEAAAVAVTVSSPANGEFAALTATDVTFGYTASATEFGIGDQITVIVSPALNTALADCTAATTNADGDLTADGAFGSFTTSSAVYTFTAATTTAATTGVDLCLRFPADTAQGSYSIAVTDNNDNDFGAALVYAGDDNDVNVTAIIGPTLSFNIRTLDDSADTNVCNMGSVDTTSQPNADGIINAGEGECGYSLAIATNAVNGFTATIQDTPFTNGTHTMADQADDTAFAAGTEGYGLAYVAPGTGAASEGVSEVGTFATDSSPIGATAANFLSSTGPVTYTAGSGAADVTAVVHGLSISSSTPTGLYQSTTTYYVTASF